MLLEHTLIILFLKKNYKNNWESCKKKKLIIFSFSYCTCKLSLEKRESLYFVSLNGTFKHHLCNVWKMIFLWTKKVMEAGGVANEKIKDDKRVT